MQSCTKCAAIFAGVWKVSGSALVFCPLCARILHAAEDRDGSGSERGGDEALESRNKSLLRKTFIAHLLMLCAEQGAIFYHGATVAQAAATLRQNFESDEALIRLLILACHCSTTCIPQAIRPMAGYSRWSTLPRLSRQAELLWGCAARMAWCWGSRS